MSYRNIKSYISVLCIYIIMWYGLDYYKLDEFEGYDKFKAIAGTSSGYGYFIIVSSIVACICMILADRQINPFSMNRLMRLERQEVFRHMMLTEAKCVFDHTLIYVGVQMMCTCIYIDFDILYNAGFFLIIPLYGLALFTIFIINAAVYLLFYICTKHSYIGIIIVVAANLFIAYKTRWKIIYGGISIVDDMVFGNPINIAGFLLYQLINLCIAGIIYIVACELYKRKDMV